MTTWPDTTGDPRPRVDNEWQQARWLVGRYPRMQVLCERVGAIYDDDEGRWPDVGTLANVIRGYDAGKPGPWVSAFGVMSGGEQRMLRVLATLAPQRVEFSIGDTSGLDDEGLVFVRDWLAIIMR